LFFVIANWPAARVDHWRTLLRARAIENQALVVGVNRIGEDPNVGYVSSSVTHGPTGAVLGEGSTTVDIEIEEVRRWRTEFPALSDVRLDRYRLGAE
jgi:predicted amidohydrolase